MQTIWFSMSDSEARFSEYVRAASRILVFTGAGISTASGIPDFRGPQGVWKTRDPVYYQDFMASEESRVEYWDQKLEAFEAFRNAKPNDVHLAAADLERAGKLEMVVTQNIDSLHEMAGTSPDRLVELHGTNAKVECQSCGARSEPEASFAFFRANRSTPLCECGGYLKLATISFGQNLRQDDLIRATKSARSADLVIALGSTLSVYPAASIPITATERGIPYVIVNKGVTEHDRHPGVSLRIEGDVVKVFPACVQEACSDDVEI